MLNYLRAGRTQSIINYQLIIKACRLSMKYLLITIVSDDVTRVEDLPITIVSDDVTCVEDRE